VDFVPTVENRRLPAPKASENRAVGRDQNQFGHGLVLQSGGVVELVYYTGPAEFLQRGMQPQLFWGTNNRTPLRPTHRGRIERLRRDCRQILRQKLNLSIRDLYLWPSFASYLLFRLQSFPRHPAISGGAAVFHGSAQNAWIQVCVRQTPHPAQLGPTWVQNWV
jgi:hypothetical protein